MDLAYNDHYKEIVSQEVQDAVTALKQDIIDGKVEPKSYYFSFASFEEFDAWRSAQQ